MDSLLVQSTWTILTALMVFVILLVTVDAEAQSTFTVQPVSVIQAERLEAVFECLHSGSASYAWFVNGLINTDPNFPLDVSTGGGLRDFPDTLTIPARPDYNNTDVQCRAVVEVGGAPQYVLSDSATLSVQGVSVIGIEIEGGNHVLSWVDHPFTTNITYCVDVIKTSRSTGISSLVSSVCELTQTMINLSHHDQGHCDKFNFTVTPTDGTTNGTSSDPMPWYIRIYNGNVTGTDVTVVGERLKQVSFSFDVPDCYQHINSTISVTANNDSVYPMELINMTNSEVILSLPNNDSNITIDMTLMDSDGVEIVFSAENISLFDIQNLTANNWSMPNKVDVYLEYAKNTSAPGALVMLVPYNQDGSLDFTNAYYYILPRNLSSSNRRVSVSGGSFKVFAIDLENSIILRDSTTAADTQIVTDVSGDEMNSTYPTDSEHIEVGMSGEGSVMVTCTDESKNSLVTVPLGRGSTRPNIRNSNGGVVYLELDGAHDSTTFVVFTWDKSGEFIDAVVSLVSTYVRPTEPTTTSSVVPQGTSGIIVGVVVPVMIVLVIIIVTAVTAILIVKVFKNNKAKWKPNQPSPDLPIHFQSILMDSPPGYESIVNLASPSQVVTTLNEYEDSPNTYRPILNTVDLQTNRQESVSEDVPPPVPDHYKPEDIVGCNLNPLVQHGYGSVSSMPSVEEPQQPLESHDNHMERYVATEPAYDVVAKKVFVKESTNSVPVIDSTATEHQYSEIHGAMNKAGLIYAHVTPKTTGPPDVDQMMDSTTVVYSEVIKDKLAPKAEVDETEPQQETVPPIPPPTVESLLLLFDFMCEKWKPFGAALGFREDQLYKYSTEGHDKVRMHEMVQDYFCDPRIQHTWEEFVQPLRTIGEFELADKIDRQYIVQESVPAIPPRTPPALPPKSTSKPNSVSRPHNGSSENIPETQTNSDEAVRSKDEQPSQASEANGEDVSTAFIAPSGTYAEDSSEDEMSTPLFSLGKFNQMTLLKSSLWDDLKSQPKRLAGALGLLNSNGAHFRTSWKKLNGTDCMI